MAKNEHCAILFLFLQLRPLNILNFTLCVKNSKSHVSYLEEKKKMRVDIIKYAHKENVVIKVFHFYLVKELHRCILSYSFSFYFHISEE